MPRVKKLLANSLKLSYDNSDLKINISKSKTITSKGARHELRDEIKRLVLIPFVCDLKKYFGFPMEADRLGQVQSHNGKHSMKVGFLVDQHVEYGCEGLSRKINSCVYSHVLNASVMPAPWFDKPIEPDNVQLPLVET